MELFLEKIGQLLPVLGADFLVPVSVQGRSTRTDRLYYEVKGARATGYRTSTGFVVEAGSTAVGTLRDSAHKYPWLLRLRERLIQDGSLVGNDGGTYRFSTDTEFDSPSGAATVVCGGTANGLTAWKDDHGNSLKTIEAAENRTDG
jgi:hypothetical protein